LAQHPEPHGQSLGNMLIQQAQSALEQVLFTHPKIAGVRTGSGP
jgi:hypothetical protein